MNTYHVCQSLNQHDGQTTNMETGVEKTEISHTIMDLPRDKLFLTHHRKKLASPYSQKVKQILHKCLPVKGK